MKKALGRPDAATLSQGFLLQAWQEEIVMIGAPGSGEVRLITIRAPLSPSFWDGPSDDENWRISYLIRNLRQASSDERTFIVPALKEDVAWDIPRGRLGIGGVGLRALKPSQVVFIKGEGPVYFSFEAALSPLSISP